MSAIDPDATSIKIGLRPTYISGEAVDDDSGLVEAVNDPDKNGVFRISDKDTQKLIVVQSNAQHSLRQEFTLSGLTVLSE